MSRFLDELKRRKVVRSAAAYIVGGFVALQAADVLVPAFGLPEWVLRLVAALVLLGFPLVLALSWAFDVTPDGVLLSRREPAEGPGPSPAGRTALFLGLGSAAGLAALAGWAWLGAPGDAAASRGDRSLAVLPFSSLAPDEESGYFASGVHEDVLTELAMIGDLAVVSRTSVMRYAEGVTPLPEIGRELGVRYVLEGSVRKDGDRVRVVAQLVDAQTDQHLWADSYDRPLADVFAVQSEIATAIADALHARLTPAESRRVAQVRSADPRAIDWVMEARALYRRGGAAEERAFALLDSAVAVDPDYADAWAWRSAVRMNLAQDGRGSTDVLQAGIADARRALELDPDHLRALTALGANLFLLTRTGEAAEYYERALALNPSDDIALNNLGGIRRTHGDFVGAARLYRRAMKASPASSYPPYNLGLLRLTLGDTAMARRHIERAEALGHARSAAYYLDVLLPLWRGDTLAAARGVAALRQASAHDPQSGIFAVVGLWEMGRDEEVERLADPYARIISVTAPPEALVALRGAAPERIDSLLALQLERNLERARDGEPGAWGDVAVSHVALGDLGAAMDALAHSMAAGDVGDGTVTWSRLGQRLLDHPVHGEPARRLLDQARPRADSVLRQLDALGPRGAAR